MNVKKYAALMIGVGLLAACAGEPEEGLNNGNNGEEPSNNNEAPEAEGERIEEDYLQVGVASDPVALDPHGANENVSNSINATIYDRLVFMNEDLELEPWLAESYEQVEDTVWEFEIREGVTFHDGEELDAEIVKMNFDRILDEDIASPVSFIFSMIEEVEVVDEYTVRMHTDAPFAALPSHLAHPGGGIVSPNMIEASYEELEAGGNPFDVADEEAAGTGYFQLEDYVSGDYVTLARNDDYWEEPANVEGVSFQVVPESLTRIGELETGGLDVIYPVNPQDMQRLEEAEGVGTYEQNSVRMAYLGFNTEAEPFDDADVRRAIYMALNKEDIVEGVLDGAGITAEGPLAPDVFGYSDSIEAPAYDPEQAQQLLEEAGYGDGLEVTLVTNDDRENEDAAALIQAQLSQIGVDVSIESYEQGTYLELAGQGDTELFLGSWGTVTLDADYGMYALYHSSNAGTSGNRAFYENDEIDALLTEARQESDEDARFALYEEAQEILADELPYGYLYYPDLVTGLSDDVEGYFQYPASFYYLRDVELNR